MVGIYACFCAIVLLAYAVDQWHIDRLLAEIRVPTKEENETLDVE